MNSVIAFTPLRGISTRLGFDKGLAMLGGHPLVAWTIRAALDSEVFDRVVVVTANEEHDKIAERYGAEVLERPADTTTPTSPDIDWVRFALGEVRCFSFSILRCTSPFRGPTSIKLAAAKFWASSGAHSLRSVRPVSQHPAKMWVMRNERLLPLLPMGPAEQPWHSSATQSLFDCFIQTAGMEFAYSETVAATGTIAGSVVIPFVLEGYEALDINTRDDWDEAVAAVEGGLVELPNSL